VIISNGCGMHGKNINGSYCFVSEYGDNTSSSFAF
jgi:hypothetical protein